MDVRVGLKKAEHWRIYAFELSCWRRLLRGPWTARRCNPSILKEIVLGVHWKDWCWSWNSNTLATWCEEPTHLKRPWCWETLRAGGEGDNRGWDGWMATLTRWTWVWVNSGLVMDREALCAVVHAFPKTGTRLNDWTELSFVRLPTREKFSVTHHQALPSRNLHKPLSLLHQRADRRNKKNHSRTAAKTISVLQKLKQHEKAESYFPDNGQDKIPEIKGR